MFICSILHNKQQLTDTHALCVTSQGLMKVDTVKGELDLLYTSCTLLTDFILQHQQIKIYEDIETFNIVTVHISEAVTLLPGGKRSLKLSLIKHLLHQRVSWPCFILCLLTTSS